MKQPENPHVVATASLAHRWSEILSKIIFCSIPVTIVLTAIPYGSVDAWWEAAFECIVFTLGALSILEGLLRGSWQIAKLKILLPIFLLTVYAFLQTIPLPINVRPATGSRLAEHTLTIDLYQTHLTAIKMLALTLFAALTLVHTSTPKRFRWLVRVVIAVGFASALFGILRQLLQSPSATSGFVLPFLDYRVGYGQFISANVFAFFMEMCLGLLIGLVLGGGVRRQYLPIYFSVGLIIWAALILSNSRGGVFGFLCQAVLAIAIAFGWYSSKRLERENGKRNELLNSVGSSALLRLLAIGVILVILVGGVLWLGGDRLAGKSSVEQSAIEGTTRREIWQSTWQLIKHNPWVGVGFGNYFLAIPEYQGGVGRIKLEQAHNDYLDLMANGGIIAILLAAWFAGIFIWRVKSSFRSADVYRRAAALGAVAGILSVAVHSLVDFGLQITGVAVVFVALVAIAVIEVPTSAKPRKT
jgi:O-antigen ligase